MALHPPNLAITLCFGRISSPNGDKYRVFPGREYPHDGFFDRRDDAGQ
jgi:hypothetical protein